MTDNGSHDRASEPSTPLDRFPPTARALVEATAMQYGLRPEDLFASWPERRRRPELEVARSTAMARLADEEIEGRKRYGLGDIAWWFGVARQRLFVHRRKAGDFQPRFERGALTKQA